MMRFLVVLVVSLSFVLAGIPQVFAACPANNPHCNQQQTAPAHKQPAVQQPARTPAVQQQRAPAAQPRTQPNRPESLRQPGMTPPTMDPRLGRPNQQRTPPAQVSGHTAPRDPRVGGPSPGREGHQGVSQPQVVAPHRPADVNWDRHRGVGHVQGNGPIYGRTHEGHVVVIERTNTVFINRVPRSVIFVGPEVAYWRTYSYIPPEAIAVFVAGAMLASIPIGLEMAELQIPQQGDVYYFCEATNSWYQEEGQVCLSDWRPAGRG